MEFPLFRDRIIELQQLIECLAFHVMRVDLCALFLQEWRIR